MRRSILQKVKQSRAFFFALVAVTIVWIVTAMAEEKNFRENYVLAYDNIDTAKYAILHCDSIIKIDISSNGFSAFNRRKERRKPIRFDLAKVVAQHKSDSVFSITLNTDSYLDTIKSQVDMRGVSEVRIVDEQLRLNIALRERKAFVPDISPVTFSFDKMGGLNGEPRIVPDSVFLYGSHTSLSKVEAIYADTQTISNIKSSGKYRITLNDDWKKYPDLRISNEEINIYIPMERFVEKSVTLPIELVDKSDDAQWNLYPANVTVQLLIPESKIGTVDLSKCVVTASTKECDGNHLTPELTTFPSSVRLKSITPESVQYIIIEK